MSDDAAPTILIIGASKGLGQAFAARFLTLGWTVIGTVRGNRETPLHALAAACPERTGIETLDINRPEEIDALRDRLAGRTIDILFVNGGTTTHDEHAQIGTVTTDEFVRVMTTNALSPMRVVERLHDLVPASGLIGVMSSGQGSIANNEKGMREVYRGSKAALNMFMRSFAARKREAGSAMLLLAPGWIRTDLGGPDAPFTLEESVPRLVDILIANMGKPGLRYLDRDGATVPW